MPRFYQDESARTNIVVPVDDAWTHSARTFGTAGNGAFRLVSSPVVGGTIAAVAWVEGSISTVQRVLFGQYVSDSLIEEKSVDLGTIYGYMGAYESSSSMNACPYVVIKLVSYDGSVVRGEIRSYRPTTTAYEFSTNTGYYSRSFPNSGSGTVLNAQIGDRVVVELGVFVNNTSSSSYTARLQMGSDSTKDDSPISSTASGLNLNPWIYFTNDPVFNTPNPPTNFIVDDINDTLGWTNNPLYPNLVDYEYSVNYGTTWTPCTSNPQYVGDNYYPIGSVQVRVKANAGGTGCLAGLALSSSDDFTIVYSFSGGSGTAEDPYHISTLQDLDNVRSYRSSHFILMNNIDASATSTWNEGRGWSSLCTVLSPFIGSLNGSNYTISALTMSHSDSLEDIGLFGYINNATIENLGLINVSFYLPACADVGPLVGEMSGTSVIENCYATGEVRSHYCVGGLIGWMTAGHVAQCHSSVNIIDETSSGGYFGGLIGGGNLYGGGNATIEDSYATGTVTGLGSYNGGFIGDIYCEPYSITINRCYATGNVSGVSNTGGFIGCLDNYNGQTSTVYKCYSTGNVSSAGGGNGGFAGAILSHRDTGILNVTECYSLGSVNNNGSSSSAVGGFVGYVDTYDQAPINIQRCYSYGSVTSNRSYTGGFVGYIYQSGALVSIIDCFAYGDVSGTEYVAGFASITYSSNVITNCYSKGLVTGTGSYIGGFVAQKEGSANPIVTNCFWDTETSEQLTSLYGTGKTTAEMKTQSTYSNWDFINIWGIHSTVNSGYPGLSSLFNYLSDDTSLSSVTINGVIPVESIFTTLNSTFTQATFTIVTTDPNASYVIYKDDIPVGSDTVPLDSGMNYIAIVVTAEDQITTSTYIANIWVATFIGDGTELDPYQITTLAQLAEMQYFSTSFSNFILMNDIDATDTINWTQYYGSGFPNFELNGTFDGNGKTISNLYKNYESPVGFFSQISSAAVVKDVFLENVNFTGAFVTGIAVFAFPGSTISGCYVTGTLYGPSGVGGLAIVAGEALTDNPCSGNTVISNCGIRASMSGDSVMGLVYTALMSESETCTVINCYSASTLTAITESYGGIFDGGFFPPTVNDCFYDSDLANAMYESLGTPKTTAEMKQQSTYTNWDFDTIWGIDASIYNGYPGLRALFNYLITPEAPTNPVIDDDNNTFGWTDNPDFIGYENYEYSVDSGLSWYDCEDNPQYVGNEDYPIGDVQVRVKANAGGSGCLAGEPLLSTSPFTYISEDATLASVSINPGTLKQITDTLYVAGLHHTVTETTFTVVTNDPNATYVIYKGVSPVGSDTVPLDIVSNEITIVVTAEDQVTTEDYHFVIQVATFTGDGTIPNPYQITTFAQLEEMNYFRNFHFKLMNDIDISEESFTPIGDWDERFSGTFDGNGKKISGLTVYAHFGGLFGILDSTAEVRDLFLENVDIFGYMAGGLAGMTFPGATISGCYVTGTIVGDDEWWASGLTTVVSTGFSGSTTISNCGVRATISCMTATGIVLTMLGEEESCTITNCYSASTLNGTYLAGGIHGGDLIYNTPPIVNDCFYNSDLVTSTEPDLATPKTTAEMKTQSTYTNWNFETTWGIEASINFGYPFLRIFNPSLPVSPVYVQTNSGTIQVKLKVLESTDPLRIGTSDVTRAFVLVDTSDPSASPIRIQTATGVKALAKHT